MFNAVGMRRRLDYIIPDDQPALWLPVDDSLISGPDNHLLNPTTHLFSEDVTSQLTGVLGFRGMFRACVEELSGVPLIMNLSASTVGPHHTDKVRVGRVIDAIRVDAQAVAYHVNYTADSEPDSLYQLASLVGEADDYGIPVVAIVYPRKGNDDGTDDNYRGIRDIYPDVFTGMVRRGVRLAVELGASAVKTVYTGSVESFKTVVQSAMDVPVLIAGEQLTEKDDAISRAKDAIRAGAAGVAYGRQVFQRKNPAAFVRELRMAVDAAAVA